MNKHTLSRFTIVCVVAVLLTAACSPQATSSPAASPVAASPVAASPAAHSKVIGFAIPNVSTPFFTTMVAGAKSVADTNGYQVVMVNADNDPSLQGSQLEDFIAKKVAGIIITPVDKDGARPFVAKAKAAGIFVVAADRGMDGVDSFVEADNYQMGQLAAGEMARLLTAKNGAAKGNVAELQGRAGVQATIDRGNGFNDALKAKYQDIKVVAAQDTQFDAEKALNITQNMLTAHPEIEGFYSHSDVPMSGAVRALQAAGKLKLVGEAGHLILVSIDGDNFALPAIRDGKMDVTVSQDPTAVGKQAAENIFKLLGGGTVEAHMKIPPVVVTKANAGDPNLWGNKVTP